MKLYHWDKMQKDYLSSLRKESGERRNWNERLCDWWMDHTIDKEGESFLFVLN